MSQGKRFQEFIKDPTLRLQVPRWLRIFGDSKKGKCAHNPSRKNQGNIREFEITESVGIIHDANYETDMIKAHFSWTIAHDARVLQIEDRFVTVDIKARKSQEYSMPKIKAGSKFELRIAPPQGEISYGPFMDVLGDDNSIKGKDRSSTIGKNDKDKKESLPRYNSQFVDLKTDNDFVLGFLVRDDEERAAFVPGEMIKVNLFIKRNNVPSTRQLTAIAKVAEPATNKNGGFSHEAMQRLLLGYGNEKLDDQQINKLSVKTSLPE